MIDSLVDILRQYPALALFLTVGVGFFIGRIKIGRFSLGSVSSVLMVGVLVGQLHIPMSGPMKMVFFMMFLFSIGYRVGPEFFKSLRGEGARQALFAVLMSGMCCASVLLMATLFHYTKGETVGLFSGSQTCSALLGVGTEAISRLGFPADVTTRELNIVPVCYAVTYIFGTLGTVIVLGNFGPRLLGGLDVVKQKAAELESKLEGNLPAEKNESVNPDGENLTEKDRARKIEYTDLMFVGLAIFIGGLFGALTVWVGGIPISFGTSGGALLSGLIFGWLRSKKPTWGHVSPGALWFMNNLGLTAFVGIIGIESGPTFVEGIRSVGAMLFLVGAVATMIPLFFGMWLGHKVFKFNPAITLGCCAGTRTCTASLGAVQDMIESNIPAIGYTVTYAVSNILLVIWGMLVVLVV